MNQGKKIVTAGYGGGQLFHNSFMHNSFRTAILVPIWEILAFYYQVRSNELNSLTNWVYILPFFLGFFLNIITQKNYGVSQILCSLFEAIGMWVAYSAKNDYQLALIGYAIMGVGSSFLTQTPLYLSKLWFDQEERIVSTFLGQYSIQFGGLIGYFYTSMYFKGIDEWEQIIYQIEQVYLVAAILGTISFFLSFLTLIKPSKENSNILIRDSQLKSIRKIFSQTEFSLDILSFSIIISFPWVYPSFLMYQQILLNQDIMVIFYNSLLCQISGISLAIYFTLKLYTQSRKGLQQNYDFYLKRFFTIGYLAFIIEILFLEVLPSYAMIVLNILIGGGINSLQSVILESLMEKHYPVSELALGQLLIGCACFFTFFLCQVLTTDIFYAFGLQLLCYFLIFPYCFIIAFYKTLDIRYFQIYFQYKFIIILTSSYLLLLVICLLFYKFYSLKFYQIMRYYYLYILIEKGIQQLEIKQL